MEEIGTGEAITGVKASVAAKALTAIRGGYSGFSTFGYLGGYLGLAMVNPFTVVIGLLMGRKALKDEKERQLTQRKQQGKMSLRKYLDEVSFQVGKESRDALRLMQRAIRDFFSTRAEELQRSIAESLGAAQEAVKADQGKRQQRLKQLQVILQRIGAMRAKVAPLAPDLAKQATGQPAPG
jgi:hypothetical protein